jgi:hypothetical protein
MNMASVFLGLGSITTIISDWPTLMMATLLLLILLLLCVTLPSRFQARMLVKNPDCAFNILIEWPTPLNTTLLLLRQLLCTTLPSCFQARM